MSAYLIIRVKVNDLDLYKSYTSRSPAVVNQYGGKFLVRGGEPTTLEGDEFNGRMVVIEFSDRQAAKDFYYSEEYQELIRMRAPASSAEFILIDGFSPAT